MEVIKITINGFIIYDKEDVFGFPFNIYNYKGEFQVSTRKEKDALECLISV